MRWTIRCEVSLPDNVTAAEVKEWARFQLAEKRSLAGRNPLAERDLEALPDSVSVGKS